MSGSRPFRDNPLLILVGIAILLAAFVALIWLPNYSAQLSPDFLSYSVLWGLSVIVLMMLVALVFVLARCFVKPWVERRRAVPFARFRTKLVALSILETYPWPGNVRELRNVLERVMIMVPGDTITPRDAMFLDGRGGPVRDIYQGEALKLREARDRFERDYIRARPRGSTGQHLAHGRDPGS